MLIFILQYKCIVYACVESIVSGHTVYTPHTPLTLCKDLELWGLRLEMHRQLYSSDTMHSAPRACTKNCAEGFAVSLNLSPRIQLVCMLLHAYLSSPYFSYGTEQPFTYILYSQNSMGQVNFILLHSPTLNN